MSIVRFSSLPYCVAYPTADELYANLISHILQQPISTQRPETREDFHVIAVLSNVQNKLITNSERALSPKFLLKEFLWMFQGRDDVFSPTMKRWAEDRIKPDETQYEAYLPGAYGKRIRHWGEDEYWLFEGYDQFERIIQMFKDDPSTRRAVLNIYDASRDQSLRTKDSCCNVLATFILNSQNKLDQMLVARSIDLHTGFPYDIFHFASFQQYIASRLGVETGQLTYCISNLHIYERDAQFLNRVARAFQRESNPYSAVVPVTLPYAVSEMNEFVVKELEQLLETPDAEWYEPWSSMLKSYKNRKKA